MQHASKPIKVIHFADLHLGMENYGRIDPATGLNRRVIDFLKSLKFMIDRAIEEDVALVVFAGDAYKNQKPSPTLQRELALQVRRLAKAGIEVFMLVGNHDLPQAEKQAHALAIFAALEAEHVTIGRALGVYHLETKDGPVDVAAVPHLSRSVLLSHEDYRDKIPSEVEQMIGDEIDRQIEGMSKEIRSGVPAILTAHLSVSSATYGSERSAIIGGEMTVPPSALARPGFDYVALGHIHKFQDLSVGYPPITYSGSLDRVDFGEERDDKGFCLVSLVKGATTYEFIKVPARPFITIAVECRTEDPTGEIVSAIERKDLSDAVVRLRVKLPAHLREQLRRDEVRRVLDSAYFVGPIEIEVTGEEVRGRNPNLTEGRGPLEALEQYILAKDDLKPREKELMEAAQGLIEETVRERVTEAV